MAPKETAKKGTLTLKRLAEYDDILTNALVDKVYYWTTIRKNDIRFVRSRGVKEEEVANILRQHVIVNKNVSDAMQRLVQIPTLKKFLSTLQDEKDREHFKRHLKRYVSIYMPDCPFEVTTTNRYTITEHEASITARRDIQKGEEIKYLTGAQVAVTEEEEKYLEKMRKDFSLVISSRKKTRSLFLGPARFANHDCGANAKLTPTGHDKMQVVATDTIKEGEEITVSYGEDYFGDDNQECLCQTCEDQQVNGWAPFLPVEDSDEEDEEIEDEQDEQETQKEQEQTHGVEKGSYSLRGKRKFEPPSEATSRDATPAPKRRRVVSKNEQASPPVWKIPRTRQMANLKPTRSSRLRQELPVASIEDPAINLSQPSRQIRTQQREGDLNIVLDHDLSSRNTTPQSSAGAGSPKSTLSTDATSIDDDHTMTGIVDDKIMIDADILLEKPALGVAKIKDETTTVTAPWSSLIFEDTSSELSELSDTLEIDDVLQQIVKRKRPKHPLIPRNTRSISRNMIQNRIGTPVSDQKLDDHLVENRRKPGDYMTSRSRLSGKDSKWAECQTCEVQFVQEDSHRGTRKECPRCERHSKLYGYPWPKTDREGKHDKEERILDHRSIHRFVDPEEEKTLKKERPKRKFKAEIEERFSTPRSCRDSSMSTEVESGRKRRRTRKTM